MIADVQIDFMQRAAPSAIAALRGLDRQLRDAIARALGSGQADLAVALDDARNAIEIVLAEPAPTPSRAFVAKARAEMALAVWRRMSCYLDG